MNANNILVSITRYIHAKYDYEINTDAVDLPLLLKQLVDQFHDSVLDEYWQDYLNSEESEDQNIPSANDANEETNSEKGGIQEEKTYTSINRIKRRMNEYRQERKARGQ